MMKRTNRRVKRGHVSSTQNKGTDILNSKLKVDNHNLMMNGSVRDSILDTVNTNPGIPIEDYRSQYRKEITVLWQEVENFKITCQKEIARQKMLLERYKATKGQNVNDVSPFISAPDVDNRNDYEQELIELDENMVSLERNQKLIDEEQTLDEREEHLIKRQEKLKQYEKDVEEAEMLLDKRQNIVHRRSDIVETLNDDLLTIKQELRENIESAETQMRLSENNTLDQTDSSNDNITTTVTNSPETSTKARRNWQLARRHLMDKVTLLETTISRYRAQVASSAAIITAKDMAITRLQKQNENLLNEMEVKDKRLKHLESQLSLTLEDKVRSDTKLDMLLEELQNIDLNATAKAIAKTERSSSKSESPRKRKLLKKQLSTFSFFTKSDHNTAKSGDDTKLRHRTSSDKSLTRVGHSDQFNEDDEHEASSYPNVKKGRNLNSSDTNLEESLDEMGSKACVMM